MSKYGFSEEYGLEFFLRAENLNASKDAWGNIDLFAKGNSVDLTPHSLNNFDKNAKDEVRAIFDKSHYLNKNGDRFSAWNKEELEPLVLLLLSKFALLLRSQVV